MCGDEVVGLIGFCFVLSVLFGSLDAFLRCCGAEVIRRGRGGLPPCGVLSPCLAALKKKTKLVFCFVLLISVLFSVFLSSVLFGSLSDRHTPC